MEVVSLAIMCVVLTLFAGIVIQGNTFLAKTKHLDQSLNEVVGKFEGVPAMDEVMVQQVGEWVNLQLTLGTDLKGNPVMVEPQVQFITLQDQEETLLLRSLLLQMGAQPGYFRDIKGDLLWRKWL